MHTRLCSFFCSNVVSTNLYTSFCVFLFRCGFRRFSLGRHVSGWRSARDKGGQNHRFHYVVHRSLFVALVVLLCPTSPPRALKQFVAPQTFNFGGFGLRSIFKQAFIFIVSARHSTSDAIYFTIAAFGERADAVHDTPLVRW